jgi:hypothetical protein
MGLKAIPGAEANVGSLAERFPISLNGISKHVEAAPLW